MIPGRHILLPTALLSLIALAGPVAAVVLAPPASGDGPLLIIAPDPARVMAAAGGREIGLRRAPLAVVAEGDGGLPTRALALGAWRVSDAAWLLELCGIN